MRKAVNIFWDVDADEELDDLPEEIEIPEGMADEDVADYLSDVTGFCHKGFEIYHVPSKEEKIAEAVQRMKKLGLYGKIVGEFRRSQKLYYSESTNIGAILYWVDNHPEWMEKVRQVEEEYGVLVYHAVYSNTEFGRMLALLTVSDYEEEWDMDNAGITDGYVFSYVLNLDYPEYSEFGDIVVKASTGGLKRVG